MTHFSADAYDASDSLLLDDAGSIWSDIGSAVSSVGSSVVHAAESVGSGVVSAGKQIGGAVYALSPVALVKTISNIAHGARVDRAVLGMLKDQVGAVRTLAPYVQTVVSMVPGVGTGAAAAIAAGAALAQGKNITQAVVDGVRGAVPGGALGQVGFDTAARAIVSGQRLDHAALDVLRERVPPVARPAFDIGVAVMAGKSLQHAVVAAGGRALANLGGGMATRALEAVDPVGMVARGVSKAAFSYLRPSVATVANALLRSPQLRGVPLAELARRFHVHEVIAREGMSAVVSAVDRMARSGGKMPGLRVEPALVNRLASHMTLDHAIARFASHAARPTRSASPTRRRGRIRASKRITSVRWKKLSNRLVTNLLGKVAAARRLPKPTLARVQNPGPMRTKKGRLPAAVKARMQARGLNEASAFENEPVIQRGSKSTQAIKDAQTALIVGSSGPAEAALNNSLNADPSGWGHFGPLTEAATKEFQRSKGLIADGKIGPLTWRALDAATAQPGEPEVVVPPAPVVVTPPAEPPPPVYAPPIPVPLPDITPPPRAELPPVSRPKNLPPPLVVPDSSPHVLQAQILLAAWGKSTTGRINPADYGTTSDLIGLEDDRFHAAVRSYQRWANGLGENLPTDGDLDDATYQSLVTYAAAHVPGAAPGAAPGGRAEAGPKKGDGGAIAALGGAAVLATLAFT